MNGLTLDAGALIAFDRNERAVTLVIWNALRNRLPVVIPAGVLGQTWRNGRTQVRLARLLRARGVEIEPLDARRAREAGQLCGATDTADVIDASVVLCAKRRGQCLVTSDTADMCRLDPSVVLHPIDRRR